MRRSGVMRGTTLRSEIRAGGQLTPRELEVLTLLASGRRAAELAIELGLSPQTIKNHLSSIYHKLDVSGLVEAFARMGWLRPDQDELTAAEAIRWLDELRADVVALGAHLDRVAERVKTNGRVP